jgi:aryl-alcohol dehydrogenase-like predicted oxidoreductase
LRRLQTDYIDLYWLHNWDKHTPIEETMAALHDLVQAGKVRYLGVSDTPAWKTTQAQLIAQFRGWSPFIGLQVEYSLLERTVEGELIPMGLELGMGVTPWSPLRGGVLSGKYTRANAGQGDITKRGWNSNYLTEKAYEVIDALQALAKKLDSTPARVALAWVQNRPGVSSTIIGARTLPHLDDNIAALEVKLPASEAAKLDALTTPTLNFPAPFLNLAGTIQNGGTWVNGEQQEASPWGVTTKGDHY